MPPRLPDTSIAECTTSRFMAATLLATLNFLLASLNFGVFVWAIRSHFIRPASGELPNKMKWVSRIFTILAVIFFVVLIVHPSNKLEFLIPGAGLLILSQIIFQWAVLVNRQEPLPIAFSEQKPSFIRKLGPYRWIRHPFYLSYSLTWLGVPVATECGWLLLASLPMIIGYYKTARAEESFLLQGDLAIEYREYQENTGMLFPKIFKFKN